ncbi:MAG: 4-oxalocrotonate tautomerase [Pseudomonadota bacterium]
MPILKIKVSGRKSVRQSEEIVALLMDITGRILGKKAEDTAITIDYIDPDSWFVGGETLADSGQNSFYFDVKITDETNTKAEKARYIREAFAGFNRILGNLHAKSYVHVEDVRATSYGYGGETQEFRYHQ